MCTRGCEAQLAGGWDPTASVAGDRPRVHDACIHCNTCTSSKIAWRHGGNGNSSTGQWGMHEQHPMLVQSMPLMHATWPGMGAHGGARAVQHVEGTAQLHHRNILLLLGHSPLGAPPSHLRADQQRNAMRMSCMHLAGCQLLPAASTYRLKSACLLAGCLPHCKWAHLIWATSACKCGHQRQHLPQRCPQPPWLQRAVEHQCLVRVCQCV